MSKQGNNQSIRKAKLKTSNLFLLIILTLLLLFSIVFSVKNVLFSLHIQKDNYMEYVGSFTVKEETRTRNTIYYISFENGDVIRVNPDHIENNEEFLSNSSLHFIYSSPRYCFSSAYHCVEIKNPSNGTLYLERSVACSEAKVGIYIGFAIAFVVFLLMILIILDTVRSHRRPRRKRLRK